MSRQSLKRMLSAVAPKTFDVIQAIRARRHSLRLQRQWGLDRLEAEFFAKFEPVVRRGPFQGMRLSRRKTTGALIARTLGAYEREIHPAIEIIISREYAVVTDVGAAEGYFAVGLALRLPRAHVYAFDLDPLARRICAETAAINGVDDRVHVHGRCDPPALQSILRPPTSESSAEPRSLVFSDCEGYEYVLLDPQRVPALHDADILVELHDEGRPQLTADLVRRFEPTHDIERFDTAPRDAADYPELAMFTPEDADKAVREVRTPGQAWLFMSARAAPNAERL